MIKNKFFSILFKLILLGFGIYGIILNILMSENFLSIISYFTIQSNIFCVLIIAYSVIMELLNKNYKTGLYFTTKMIFTMAIIITCLVFNFILQPTMEYSNYYSMSNLCVHLITPILMFLDYILFDIKGSFKIYFPFAFMLYPMIYCLYVYAYSRLGGRFGGNEKYPYFFLDVDTLGVVGVLKWVAIIVAIVLFLGFLFYGLDKLLNKILKINKNNLK